MGRGKVSRAFVAALAIWVLYDVLVPPRYAIDARVTVMAIDSYRAHISPHLSSFVVCRFRPSCSMYGRESVRKYGFARGSLRAVWRIARCGPWTPMGTADPP